MDVGTMVLIEFVLAIVVVCITNACFDKQWDKKEKAAQAKADAAKQTTK